MVLEVIMVPGFGSYIGPTRVALRYWWYFLDCVVVTWVGSLCANSERCTLRICILICIFQFFKKVYIKKKNH